MNLLVSFSARENGNCDSIARFIKREEDTFIALRKLNIHSCSNCDYECMSDVCKYRDDDMYNLYESMLKYDRVYLVVPMYCGNPSSLYFVFNERCQDYFMHNDTYKQLVNKLYIIAVYGSEKESPNYVSTFNQWFDCDEISSHILGIERHNYSQKINDSILDVEEVRESICKFVEK